MKPDIFDPITLSWNGKDYVIPADRVLGAIARIEETVTATELARYSQGGNVPVSKLSSAYGSVLRYAGAVVTDEEVYAGLLAGGERQAITAKAIAGLLGMMIPPERSRGATVKRGKRRPAARKSSRKSTKSRSG